MSSISIPNTNVFIPGTRIPRPDALTRVNLYNSTRHSFACQMLNGGIDKGQVSKLLRHSDPKMIERYADYEMEILRKSVDNVRRVNFNIDKKTGSK